MLEVGVWLKSHARGNSLQSYPIAILTLQIRYKNIYTV